MGEQDDAWLAGPLPGQNPLLLDLLTAEEDTAVGAVDRVRDKLTDCPADPDA